MRFLADLPLLKRNFAELGPRGWRNLVMGNRGEHAELVDEAWPIYVEEYDLVEYRPTIPMDAAREYLAAFKARRLPRWVQDFALTREIKRAARLPKRGDQ
ncbi:hypothetical protein DAERI_060102 [Deinococcus aerius]|uniref:Uncharacterized protein n=1 Tax=Deinococcus aerius TaxID=200253 RepID=A0A2I9CVB7_9DEIO|nr:hypothetical protein [Deinococcus aerius]GBF05842.1 hypothetical protein DAERI_060102 [Deinococcus aerius]